MEKYTENVNFTVVNPRSVLQTLAEILSEREMIGHLMENILDEATRPWGVKVERVEIKVSKII